VTSLVPYYVAMGRVSIQRNLQYRGPLFISMVGFLAEPVVYLVVWQTVAAGSGGTVGGLDAGQIAGYYVVWTLVRNWNLTLSPGGWEWRIREGRLVHDLMRPVHVIHHDLAEYIGGKVVWFTLWVPIGITLWFLFDPEVILTPTRIAFFLVAIWLAFLVRTFLLAIVGSTAFWTTRVVAVADVYLAFELFLSGRLVPLSFLPDPVEAVSTWLPFAATFAYPTQLLTVPMSTLDIVTGLALQVGWAIVMGFVFSRIWRRGVATFTAVGQ